MAISPNDRYLAVSDMLHEDDVCLYDARTLTKLQTLPGPPQQLRSSDVGSEPVRIAWHPHNGLLARVYHQRVVLIQSPVTGKIRTILQADSITGIDFDPGEGMLAVAGQNYHTEPAAATITIYDPMTGRQKHAWRLPHVIWRDICFVAPQRLVTLRDEKLAGDTIVSRLDLWDTTTGKSLSTVTIRPSVTRMHAVSIPHLSTRLNTLNKGGLVLGLFDGSLCSLDVHLNVRARLPISKDTGEASSPDTIQTAHARAAGEVNSLTMLPHKDLVVSAHRDGSLFFWTWPHLHPAGAMIATTSHLTSIAVSNDELATTDGSGQVIGWSLIEGTHRFAFRPDDQERTREVDMMTLSPNARQVAIARSDYTIEIWDTDAIIAAQSSFGSKETAPDRVLRGHTVPIWGMAFAPNGTRFASRAEQLGRYEEGFTWDVLNGNRLATFATKRSDQLAFSPDGRIVAVASRVADGLASTLGLFDAETGNPIAGTPIRLGDANMSPAPVTFSPNGRYVTVGYGEELVVWDRIQLKIAWRRQKAHSQAISALAFSHNGQMLASGGGDNSVCIWNINDGSLRAKFTGHNDSVAAIAFMTNDYGLVSAGNDGQAILWNIKTGKRAATFLSGSEGSGLIVLPNLCYASQKSGTNLVAFRVGERAYPFDAFDLVYNRPDLVLRTLAEFLPEEGEARRSALLRADAYYEAYVRRCKRNGMAPAPKDRPAIPSPLLPKVQSFGIHP